MTAPDYLDYRDRRYVPEVIQFPEINSLWRVQTDYELGRTTRPNLPMVYYFRDEIIPLSREWQWFLIAINYGMDLNSISHLLKDKVAFCNGTGVGMADDPRQNWILNEDLSSPKLPAYSRCFTCGDAVAELKDGIITSFDGTKPPPLKAGYWYPMDRGQAIKPEVYLYTPQTHPSMFFEATTTGNDFKAHPFPGGAVYPWHPTPVSFMFHIGKTPITWPPTEVKENTARLVKL